MHCCKSQVHCVFLLLLSVSHLQRNHGAVKRSIDMSASYALSTDDRLPKDVLPLGYELHLDPNFNDNTFSGSIKIHLNWTTDSKKISIHSHYNLNINDRKIKLYKISDKISDGNVPEYVTILRGSHIPKKTIYVVYLKETVKKGVEGILEIPFDGSIWNTPEGFFTGNYANSTYYATNLRLNNARRLFPCHDEPAFKIPYTVSISRPKHFVTLFNTALNQTVEHPTHKDYVIDHFEKTPSMSSFTFGFIIAKLQNINDSQFSPLEESTPKINVWHLTESQSDLKEVPEKIRMIYAQLQNYFGLPIPLPQLNVVIIPDLSTVRPVDNWGLMLIKEADIMKKSYYDLTHELIYQWLGCWLTPEWWSVAHINKGLASFIAAEAVMQIDGGIEFNGKYPMTTLYSLYYEFSKRYPHSRITGMKQETVAHKSELIMRMLNFTLSRESFQNGIRNFITEYQYRTYVGDNLWDSLTAQAHKDHTLKVEYQVTDIANSWLANQRLPVVSVRRDYTDNTAMVQQKLYLRERPHDVPGQDKMLWWIPIVLNRQNTLNFSNYLPYAWVEKTQQLKLKNMPDKDQFIIVNQEEAGPFPVNYDEYNWKMLSNYLQSEEGRRSVPTYTRAKLLHDAWNLAYAGDLSFATAFNMTLFMKYERDAVVWSPVFTFIDQIGRHIDMSEVHRKFESYVLFLLTPLYEELGVELGTEDSWKTDLRSLTRRFLCRVGYSPCIKEAQQAFRFWQDSTDPDSESPIPSHYICPVFRWGTIEEWEFGLKRFLQFPKNRTQSERTHLLKSLAGCPRQADKINKLLQLSVLEENSNFTETDQFLIFTSLTGGSSGYYALFHFLSDNWSAINQKLKNKTNLWDHLIGSATGFFVTQNGYELVQQLYEKHAGEFESAQHIIEKSLRNIKEEAKWSEGNLPVIESWLDTFLSSI